MLSQEAYSYDWLFAGSLSASASQSGLGFLTAWQVSSYGDYPWREQGRKREREIGNHTEESFILFMT